MPEFGTILRALRMNAGLTLQQLATAAGLHWNAVARLERSERQPSLATALALARALGVDCTAFAPTQKESGRQANKSTATRTRKPKGSAHATSKGKRRGERRQTT